MRTHSRTLITCADLRILHSLMGSASLQLFMNQVENNEQKNRSQ